MRTTPRTELLTALLEVHTRYGDFPNIHRELYTAYTDLKARIEHERLNAALLELLEGDADGPES